MTPNETDEKLQRLVEDEEEVEVWEMSYTNNVIAKGYLSKFSGMWIVSDHQFYEPCFEFIVGEGFCIFQTSHVIDIEGQEITLLQHQDEKYPY